MRIGKSLCALGFTAACAGVAARGDLNGQTNGKPAAAAAFARFKALEGRWTGRGLGKATSIFEVVANGTVVLERYSNPDLPGGGHMVTAYHLDGDRLVLTHYCIANNQPTLRAERFDAATAEVQFEFVHATNLANADAGHMRRAKYRFEDADHFTTEWEFFEKGKQANVEVERFTRVR